MTDLDKLEITIEEANKMRTLRDKCVKFQATKLYKDIIEDGYFKEEAARLVMAKSSNLAPAFMDKIDGMIIGVGALQNYFESIMFRGDEMDTALGEAEEARTEILAEELENGSDA